MSEIVRMTESKKKRKTNETNDYSRDHISVIIMRGTNIPGNVFLSYRLNRLRFIDNRYIVIEQSKIHFVYSI